ncbi:Com family DNA-binding transcriptional regulator [Oceanobacter sp. 4_MG-2023]|uniref:Com family DNA-binding transcriptional regulator n=1 Tax=Oceanobacter sp. 4_MG-2023 TaxID=3062623 RepID=UPI00351E0BDD
MHEVRCTHCNKLLCRMTGTAHIEVKCPRCGTINIERREHLLDELNNSHRRTCGHNTRFHKKWKSHGND